MKIQWTRDVDLDMVAHVAPHEIIHRERHFNAGEVAHIRIVHSGSVTSDLIFEDGFVAHGVDNHVFAGAEPEPENKIDGVYFMYQGELYGPVTPEQVVKWVHES
jgi:hypothetical protein